MAADRPLVLLWINEAGPYREALARAGPDRRVEAIHVPLTEEPTPDLLARGTHRAQMPENILGALFHLTKPYAGVTLDQRERRWRRRVSETLAGKTLGILGLGVIASSAPGAARRRCPTWSACTGRRAPKRCWPPRTSCSCSCR